MSALKILTQLILKDTIKQKNLMLEFTGQAKKGIASLENLPVLRRDAESKASKLLVDAKERGMDLSKLSAEQIKKTYNFSKEVRNQKLKNIESKFYDPSGKMKPEGEDIVKKGLEGLGKKKKKPSDDLIRWFNEITGEKNVKNLFSKSDQEIKDLLRKEGLKPVQGADVHPFQGFTPKIVPKGVSDEVATSQINKLRENLPSMSRNELNQLVKDVINRKAYASFDDAQRKELLEAIEYQTTHKPDFASGGIARVGMFGGGPIVKGGRWFLKSLRDTRKQMKTMRLSPGQLKYYLDQIDDQIKNIEAGGKIPDEVIQTIRKDPKFKSVSQTRANDPDLREMEEVLLEYGEKHASGGIAGELHLNEGGRAKFAEGTHPWLDIKKEMYDLFPAEDLAQIFADLRPSPITDTMKDPGITIGEIKDWGKRNTAPGILQTALESPLAKLESPLAKIASYDKDVMPEKYKIPGSGGYGSILRHAGNTALLKKHLSEKMEPYTGKGIADLAGAIGAFGGGTLHELTAESPIWVDEKRTVDEALPFDVGPSKKLSPEFKEDMLANLYGALYGKTGIKDKEVLDRLIERLSRKDNWSEIFSKLIAEQAHEDPERPMKMMPRMIPREVRNPRTGKTEIKMIMIDSPFSNKKLTRKEFIEEMEDKGKLATPATEGSFAKGGLAKVLGV